jgi:predicted DNA-binding protein
MADTKRTTVSLSQIYMDMVDELVGVYGRTRAAVITNIVQHFFNSSDNFSLLNELKERKKRTPNENLIEQKVQNLLKGAKTIRLGDFLDYLGIDKNYLFNKLDEWKEKFNIELDYDKIRRKEQ